MSGIFQYVLKHCDRSAVFRLKFKRLIHSIIPIFCEVAKMSYHHKSGALKRRERKCAIEAQTEVMSKTVKLTEMFGKQRSVTV